MGCSRDVDLDGSLPRVSGHCIQFDGQMSKAFGVAD